MCVSHLTCIDHVKRRGNIETPKAKCPLAISPSLYVPCAGSSCNKDLAKEGCPAAKSAEKNSHNFVLLNYAMHTPSHLKRDVA